MNLDDIDSTDSNIRDLCPSPRCAILAESLVTLGYGKHSLASYLIGIQSLHNAQPNNPLFDESSVYDMLRFLLRHWQAPNS